MSPPQPPHPPPPRGSESRPEAVRRPPAGRLAPPVRSADADRPSPPPEGFYDGLAAVYHLIYPDWPLARRHQGEVFAALLEGEGIAPGAEILDCAAGIGTQALGLAAAGYRVTATDISPAALQRLAAEARLLHLPLQARASDIRALGAMIRNPRDAVLAIDNAIPHLLSEHQIIVALRALAAVLRPGGLLLLSMRDFDRCLDEGERPFGEGPFIHEGPPRRILYQVWDWQDERLYDAHLYITWRDEQANGDQAGGDRADGPRDGPGSWKVHHGVTRYRALRRAELARMARSAGFSQCSWMMPEESGFFQPVMIARRQ
ncbi:class I SAM-dependent methyltransferase [Marinibaculum pumilum]|uniref:Class I SAM-dependent methyltransferase n=1 Tax=Marinibaculum pumilum TaxID=1766165 RepID=A0ABV7L9H3_9PROT